MPRQIMHRPLTALVMTMYFCAFAWPGHVAAQTPECGYDRSAPSLASARASFQEFDFACAERELGDLLKVPKLAVGIQADAHALLAAIYFQTLPDNQNRREKVIEEFRRTYSLRPDWKGQPEIQTPAFRDLMTEAKRQVDQLSQKEKPATPSGGASDKSTPAVKETKPTGGGKSKKTWLYVAAGAAAVGVAVLALGGGGGGGGNGGGEGLPYFPPPPGGSNR